MSIRKPIRQLGLGILLATLGRVNAHSPDPGGCAPVKLFAPGTISNGSGA